MPRLKFLSALALFSVLLTACATTTPTASDPIAPAVAAAQAFQQALANQNFDAALALVADDFTSTAWPTREDVRVYLVEARDRGFFSPATVAAEAPQGTLTGERVRVYPVGLRSRAGVAVFDLTLAPRGDQWKIVNASLEFY